MNWIGVVAVIAGLVAVSTAAGLVWRARQGSRRAVAGGERVDLSELRTPDATVSDHLGSRATLVQFSTAFCSACPGTRRVLTAVSAGADGVAYLDVDVTERADLMRRFGILQTPTTLVLDRHGVVRSRIGGAVRRAVVEQTLQEMGSAS
jgi:thiol:disulfide interchange protein